MVYPPLNDYSKRVESETWSSLAHMASTFKINVKENGCESRKLKKELELLKHILHQQLKHHDESGGFNSAFLVGMFKTIRRFENSFEKLGIIDRAFILFLKALLHKAKKQRLIVVKPMERVFEFKKIKTMRDQHDYLRPTDKD